MRVALRINFNFALRETRSEFVGTTTSSRRNICGQRGNPTSAWEAKARKDVDRACRTRLEGRPCLHQHDLPLKIVRDLSECDSITRIGESFGATVRAARNTYSMDELPN